MRSWVFIISTACFLVLVESQFYTQKRHYINEIQCLFRDNTKVHPRKINGLLTCGVYYRVSRVVVSTDIHFHCFDDLYACTTVGVSGIHKGCYEKMSIPQNSVCKISEQMRYLPCNSDEFQCKKSGLCIKRRLVWNQYNECSTVGIVDTSDEEKPLESCDENTEFRCNTSRTCIPREWVTDFFTQCRDGSDERRNAVNWLTCDPKTEYRCPGTGRCILRHRVKDHYVDCWSTSDERGSKLTCFNDTEFDCGPDDRCIPRAWVGNGKYDCMSERDENVTSMECVGDEFGCLDKSRCLPRKYLCDGKQHCADGSDETSLCDHPRLFTCLNDTSMKIPWSATFIADSEAWSCPDGSHLNTKRLLGFKCAVEYKVSGGERKTTSERKLIPQFHLHHNISVCADRSDQCFAVDGQFTCARCLEGTTIIANSQVCDGFVDCPDLSDECSCEASEAKPLCQLVYAEKEDESVDISLICDGKVDYGDGLDEEFCDIGNLTATTNSNSYAEHYECHSRNGSTSDVISQDLFCDGGTDCASGEDECSKRCASNKLGKLLHTDQSSDFLQMCYNATLVSNDMESCRNFVRYSVETHRIKLYYMDEFATKLKACYDEIDRLCYQDPDACPWRFRCGSDGQTVDISAVCDYNIDCGDVSDELQCSDMTHFYCRQGKPRFIARARYMDGIADCEDRSDEL